MAHKDLPPLTWLRAFEAAARNLSFTMAAAELNVTQAAISKHVRSLELHVQQSLFTRRPRSLELTKSGAAYLPKVQDALERLSIGTREVFGRRRNRALTLRCSVSFAANWLSSRLPAFLDQHPGLTLRIISSVWNESFDKDLFDLDIQYGTGEWAGFDSHRLTWEEITPLCAPSLLARSPLRAPDDLRGHRLLHVLGYQQGWGVWLNAAGAKSVDPGLGLQLDNSVTALEIAAQGGGVALGRSSLTRHSLETGRLVAPYSLAVPIDEAFYLLVPKGAPLHPDAELVVGWLRRQAGTGRTTG